MKDESFQLFLLYVLALTSLTTVLSACEERSTGRSRER